MLTDDQKRFGEILTITVDRMKAGEKPQAIMQSFPPEDIAVVKRIAGIEEKPTEHRP